ncbi:MAG: hypothetical protein PUP93_22980, partial [Rhizonema sp. NSF051]|nr:hypothetical protein [Rhizonema sp. NSF051]
SSTSHDFSFPPSPLPLAPLLEEVSNLPVTEIVSVDEPFTRFSSPTPPTERYMLGWNPGDQVIANSVVPTFERWCQSKPVLIEFVQGKVGSVQQLTVVRCDGESRMSFGNWVEEIKSENTTPKGAAVASVEVDYGLLSDALKKAANWLEVEQLVERDSSRLTFAVKEWTPVQKNSLRDFLTSYLESDADALRKHQVDWLPVASLEKSFKQLFFKVKNVMEGLTAPWLNGFAFVHVDDFGLNTEEWIFIDPASSQNIKVCDRKDFAVQAS